MFKELKVKQGSDEWFQARLGKLTASSFDKLITTKTRKASTQAEEAVNKAVAELIIGKPEETYVSDAMQRGTDLEPEARDFINFTYGHDFKESGFLDSELGYGCSPDGMDSHKKIGLEIKIPMAHTHISYIVGEKMPDKYFHQVQGAMLVTGFEKWVFVSYHPSMKCFRIEVERDEDYISKLKEILTEKCALIAHRFEKYSDYKREF